MHGRQTQYGGHVHRFPTIVSPGVAVLRFRVLDEVENLNVSLPRDFPKEQFHHWNGREVVRSAAECGSDRFL